MEPRVPGWIQKFIKSRRNALVRQTGMVADAPTLGCGHYGCVLPCEDPRWVVKITRDPTEGPMVQKVIALRAESSNRDGLGPQYHLDGIVFYKALFEAGKISWQGREWPVYVIVREAIEPTRWTYRGLEPAPKDIPAAYVMRSVTKLRKAMDAARAHAVHKTPHRKDADLQSYIDAITDVGDAFPYIGETMVYLLDNGLVMQDVHLNNIGVSTVDWGGEFRQPGTFVIHDLGHTPTDPSGPFTPLSENPGGLRFKRWTVEELDALPLDAVLVEQTRPPRAIAKMPAKPREVTWAAAKEWVDYDLRRKQPWNNSEWYTAKYVVNVLQSHHLWALLENPLE